MRTSIRLSTVGDDDDYDLHAMVISDGFRPPSEPQTSSPPNENVEPRTQPTPAVPESITASRPAPTRPSSIAKPPRPHDSFALNNDGGATTYPGPALSRVSSASTNEPIIRAESPYQGPSGPSHPYQMYPQRTVSVATTSTTQVAERSYTGPQQPTHLYGLYTQTTAQADGVREEGIPVGFLGSQDDYRRRIGPDGEDAADLIGPLGHTEELPPYTRYPEQSYSNKTTIAATNTEPSLPAVTPLQIIPGAGGLGLATRNPEFASTEDLDSPRSRLSTRSFTSDSSHHEINTAAREITEKDTTKKWQKRAKKRMWGIVPYWAICLLAVALVLMGVILGSVIGTFLAKQHKKPPPRNEDDP
jgi:hypothetical protein